MAKKQIPAEELALFQQTVADIKPMAQDTITERARPTRPRLRAQQTDRETHQANHLFSESFEPYLPAEGPMRYVREGFDHFELKRLRRGVYPPEITLDLHGLTQQQAKLELAALIAHCKVQHFHCAAVIHGIGKHILKQRVPNWLAQHPDVQAFHQAPLEYGGDGALLVLIDVGVNRDELRR